MTAQFVNTSSGGTQLMWSSSVSFSTNARRTRNVWMLLCELQFNKQIKRAEGQKPPKVELTVSVDGVTVQEPKYKVSQGAGTKVQGESGCRNQSKTLSCAARILCGASWGGGWQSADLQNLQLPFPRTLSEFSLPILRWQAVLFWEKVLSSLVSLFQVMQHRFPLHRISYCADDKSDKRIFTFIAKEADSNKHHCFVFDSEKCVSASGYSLSRRGS